MSALTVKYVAPLFGNRLSPVDFCLLEREWPPLGSPHL
jgi:hypothetical protein